MKSICNFIPNDEYKRDIKYYHFVYETELKKLKQPFFSSCYRMSIVVKGSGKIKTNNIVEKLEIGTVFFIYPQQSFQIEADDSFTFLYISFDGEGTEHLFRESGVTRKKWIYHNYEDLISFCMSSLRRIGPSNARIITESVLMYVLSYMNQDVLSAKNEDNKFDEVIVFLNRNFSNKDITLKKVSEIFFYNEKYFSALFKRKMKVNFNQYLNTIRINYALELMKDSYESITETALKCGFSDPMYFSKVFKKYTGASPSDYYKDEA